MTFRGVWLSGPLACALAQQTGVSPPAPLLHGWQISPAAATASPSLRAVLPGVHSVETSAQEVVVRSAGLALYSWGPLEVNHYDPPGGVRRLQFRFPLSPQPARERVATPLGITGAFLNGVPIYNSTSTLSYRDQNLWHQDAVATAAAASAMTPALQALLTPAQPQHSPLIAFALDGFPIYGPFGFDAVDGSVQRVRSSYRLRSLQRRNTWPDGTSLLPGQWGPEVSAAFPLGTFVEDYEYVAGLGDLDESNGRFARTPEYPQGTFAYFLASTAEGRLAYPYLIGPTYAGRRPLLPDPSGTATAGLPFDLRFDIRNRAGRPQLFLEKRHEKPLHLVIVSEDLAEFSHVHPEPVPGGGFALAHTFPQGGRYHLYADYTVAGERPTVKHTTIDVQGPSRGAQLLELPAAAATRPRTQTATVGGIEVTLTLPDRVVSGVDLPVELTINVTDLDPYLGEWAHFVVISHDHEHFIHAHPLEAMPASELHEHGAVSGPSPQRIHTSIGFRRPGLYRLWAQVQWRGKVIDLPFAIEVGDGGRSAPQQLKTPEDVFRIAVSAEGFSPAEVPIRAGQKVRLGFLREDAQNCGAIVRIPALQLERKLPPGELVVVDFNAPRTGSLTFTCGIGMYKGALIVQ